MTTITAIPPVSHQVSTPAVKQTSFKQENFPHPDSIKEYPDYYELTYKTGASTGKKIGVGVASYFIPGLGQAINGEWGKGLKFLGGFLGSAVVGMLFAMGGANKKTLWLGNIGAIAGILGCLGIKIGSIVDAVKNTGEITKQIVPKQQG